MPATFACQCPSAVVCFYLFVFSFCFCRYQGDDGELAVEEHGRVEVERDGEGEEDLERAHGRLVAVCNDLDD